MNKKERERVEREKLKNLLESTPKLKEIIDNMIDNPNPEMKDIVAESIKSQLEKARFQGVLIGWNSFAIRAIKNIESMKIIEEVKKYFQQESDNVTKKLNMEIGAIEDVK